MRVGIRGRILDYPQSPAPRCPPAITSAGARPSPAGLDTATGLIGDPCVRATATMTLALPKVGLGYAPTVVGELYLADISVPGSVYQAFGIELVDPFDEGSVVSITA